MFLTILITSKRSLEIVSSFYLLRIQAAYPDIKEVVGHLPQNILKVISLYLSLPHCYQELEVTGKCVNHGGSYGLEILARLKIQWLEMRLTKIEEQLKRA